MAGCGIHSNNPHQEAESAKELGSVVNEIITPDDEQLKLNIVLKKIIELENGKQTTLHSETVILPISQNNPQNQNVWMR